MHAKRPAMRADAERAMVAVPELPASRASADVGAARGVVSPFETVEALRAYSAPGVAPSGLSGKSAVALAERPCEEGEKSTRKDHFVIRGGQAFAGLHLILDLWGASRLGDLPYVERCMRDAVQIARATLLHIHLHHFGPGSGVSGVAVLAESHISVHTWPERAFAAFDVFMCGEARPERAVEHLVHAFDAERSELTEVRRGLCRMAP